MRIRFLRPLLFPLLLVAFNNTKAQSKPPQDSLSVNGNPVFEKVEVEASVDAKAWIQHLQTELKLYVDEAVRKGIKPGTYTVNVRFLVEKNGRITDVKALNDPGYGLASGAVRTVRTGPLWTAGEMSGKKVRSYHTQPIMFSITEK